jgi:large subunit ribosomal protein L30
MSQIKITQERSKIRCLKKHKRTLEALGLRRPRHSVIHNDTPQIRGMVAQVSYLVRVEPALDGAAPGEALGTRQAASKPKPRTTKPKRAAAGRSKRAAVRAPKRTAAKAGRTAAGRAKE